MDNRIEWNANVIMTSSEVARFLKVHLGSVRHWTHAGELKGYRLGERGDWRYLQKDVLDFLSSTARTRQNRSVTWRVNNKLEWLWERAIFLPFGWFPWILAGI